MKNVFNLIDKNLLLTKLAKKIVKKPKKTDNPVITISREFGSSGSIIAENVAKKLGKKWKTYHSEIVDRIAKDVNLEKKWVDAVDESKIPLINLIVGDLFGKKYINLRSYSLHLTKILNMINNKGFAVIVGRGGNFILPKSLKIQVITDMDKRIKTIIDTKKVSKDKAIEMIRSSDRKRGQFIKELFNHSWKNSYHYDIVIKTGDLLTDDDAVDLIVKLAKKKFNI
jgi:cytidylate kinase